MASQDWFDKDFYAVLGVKHDATDAEIKKAYRKLARRYHPDTTSGDKSAEHRFKDITEAHAVLSDAEKRREYDAVRAMAKGGPRFTAGTGGPGGPGSFSAEDLFGMFGEGMPHTGGARFGRDGRTSAQSASFEDLLSQMGGGFNPSNYGRVGQEFFGASGPRAGSDVTARVSISFRQAVQGDTVTLQLDGGTTTVRIPPGVREGSRVRLRGKGRPGDTGAKPGDLILEVSVKPHPVFGRDGNNLTIDLPVTFPEAVLGSTVSVPTLDGGAVRVKLAPGTPNGRVLRVRGRGVASSKGTGDLLVRVLVDVPQELSEEARAAVEQLQQELAGHDPRAELRTRAGA